MTERTSAEHDPFEIPWFLDRRKPKHVTSESGGPGAPPSFTTSPTDSETEQVPTEDVKGEDIDHERGAAHVRPEPDDERATDVSCTPDEGHTATQPRLGLPPGYEIRKDGVYFRDPKPSSGAKSDEYKLCGPLEFVAQTCDEHGTSWGLLLRWRDPNGRWHEFALPRAMLAGDGAEARRVLLDGGLYVAAGQKARNLLTTLLSAVYVHAQARAVARIGWHGDAFVLPDGAIGSSGDHRVLLQTESEFDHAFAERGSLADWQREVATLAAGNSRLVLSICAALAAPLLALAESESGIVHLVGPSSCGKTTALRIAGSVWGGGGVKGYLKQWRATDNGLEALAVAHCDTLLCLDELSQIDSIAAGPAAYMLANGQGKQRALRTGAGRRPAVWRILALSSGEITIGDKVTEDGRRRATAGQQVRVIDVPADAGLGMGLFETLHGYPSAETFARQLQAVAGRYYGKAARAFLAKLVKTRDGVANDIAAFKEELLADHCGGDVDGQVRRVADRFALLAAAGELAIAMDILPWPNDEAQRGCAACFAAWLTERGSTEPAEVRDGMAQVRRFLEQHGDARFTPLSVQSDARPTPNRAGFRSDGDQGTEYFILPQVFRTEVTNGFSAKLVVEAMAQRGWLETDDGRNTCRMSVPGMGQVRGYRVTAAFLQDADAAADAGHVADRAAAL